MAEINQSKVSAHSYDFKKSITLNGCLVIPNPLYKDNRGIFRKVLPIEGQPALADFKVAQVNVSNNFLAGTIRGLHFQTGNFVESKIVSCIKGSVFDVLLDLRPDSATYGQCAFYHLTPESGSLLVSPLIAHGFQTLEDDTTLLYIHSNHYSQYASMGVNPFDPDLAINWPLATTAISEADKNLPRLSEVIE